MTEEIRIEGDIFEDLRIMANRHIQNVCKKIAEENFVDGKVTIEINVNGYTVAETDEEKLKSTEIRYKVGSQLKQAFSENNTLMFEDRILAKDLRGEYHLEVFSGDQVSMLEG